MGDVIQAMPVAAALKKQYPDAEIHWFVFDAYRDLFREHQVVNQIWASPPGGWWSPARWGAAKSFFDRLKAERYDCALDLQGLFRSGCVTALSGAKRRIGLHPNREWAHWFYQEMHHTHSQAAAARYLEGAVYLGVENADPYDFSLGAAPQHPVLKQTAKPYIVLHPFARWETKIWPWIHYQTIIEAFPQMQFVIVGQGKLEAAQAPAVIDLRGRLTLWELMGIIRHAQALISSDSGPAHLAAAYGIPTYVLFGATDPARTAPVGRKVHIFKEEGIPCAPCLSRTCHHAQPLYCMQSLSPQRIIEAIRQVG